MKGHRNNDIVAVDITEAYCPACGSRVEIFPSMLNEVEWHEVRGSDGRLHKCSGVGQRVQSGPIFTRTIYKWKGNKNATE